MGPIKTFFLLLLIGIGSLFVFLPNMSALNDKNPSKTSFMKRYESKTDQKAEFIWVDENQISNHLKRAVLASEDDTFFDHEGFNWEQIKKAAEVNWKAKSYKRGASTITQQLVKNLYLGPTKSIFRKLREAILTYQMEMTVPKKRILELYLNVVEWGPGVFGAEAAAQHHFHKTAARLSPSEAAYLAAILPNPVSLGSAKRAKYTKKRANLITYRMRYVRLGPQEAKPVRDKAALTEAFSEKAEEFLKKPEPEAPVEIENPAPNPEVMTEPVETETVVPEY